MSELLPCPFCGKRMNEENFFSCDGYPKACGCWETTHTAEEAMTVWNTRPIEDELRAELAALKSENVNLSKKVTDYEKELRQSYKYDKTCSTCRYLDENRNCVLGIRCVNYTLWQGKIL